MSAVVLVLPFDSPPIRHNDRRHHLALNRERQQVSQAIALIAGGGRVKPVERAEIVLHWLAPNRIRRDTDGIEPTKKAVIDGLVRAGVLPDDDYLHVPRSWCEIHPPGTPTPAKCWLEIRPLEAAQPGGLRHSQENQ